MANHERLSPHAVRVAEGGAAFELVAGRAVPAGGEARREPPAPPDPGPQLASPTFPAGGG